MVYNSIFAYEPSDRDPGDAFVSDIRGRTVWSHEFGSQPAGTYTVTWRGREESGREVAGGTYFARLVLDGAPSGVPAKLTLVK